MPLDDIIKLFITIGGTLFTAGGIYGLVRADLRNMHERFDSVNKDIGRIEKNTEKAHERLDSHISTYHRGV